MNDASVTSRPLSDLSSGARTPHLPPIRDAPTNRLPVAAVSRGRDNGYRAPVGDIDFITNYQREYSRKTLTPTKLTRKERLLTREDLPKFDSESTYHQTYRNWGDNIKSPRDKQTGRGPPSHLHTPSGRIVGPSRYASDFAAPVGSRSPPGAPRLTLSSAEMSKPPNSQQITSVENTLNTADDEDRPLDDATVYRQDYGVRQTVPPARSRRTHFRIMDVDGRTPVVSPNGQHLTLDEGALSNYQRDFTRKELLSRRLHQPQGDSVLVESHDGVFDGTSVHRATFRRWKADRLKELEVIPAAGDWTGGIAGREPPSQVKLEHSTATDSARLDSTLTTTTQVDYGNAACRSPVIVAAGLPTPGLDRRGQQPVSHRRVDRLAMTNRLAESSSTSINDPSDVHRPYNEDHRRTSRRGSPGRRAIAASSPSSANVLPGDLQAIHRHFLMGYVRRDDVEIVESGHVDASSRDTSTCTPQVIIRRPTQSDLKAPHFGEQPDIGDNTANASEWVVDGSSLEVPGSKLEESDVTETHENAAVAWSNVNDSLPPIFAPTFKGHYNYGFEYEKWAQQNEEERRASLSPSSNITSS